eukprot:371641-Amphidinium_carterae.1
MNGPQGLSCSHHPVAPEDHEARAHERELHTKRSQSLLACQTSASASPYAAQRCPATRSRCSCQSTRVLRLGGCDRNLRTLGALETVTRSKCQGTSCLTERAKALSGPGTHSMREDKISSACRRSGSHLVVSVSGAVKFASTECWVARTGSKGQLGVQAMSPACAADPQACSTAWHAM